jgi:hypothetical protein
LKSTPAGSFFPAADAGSSRAALRLGGFYEAVQGGGGTLED